MLLRMACAGLSRVVGATNRNGAAILVMLVLVSASGCRPDATPADTADRSKSSASVEADGEPDNEPTSGPAASDDVAGVPDANPQALGGDDELSRQGTLALADDVAALGDAQALAFAALLRDSVVRQVPVDEGAQPQDMDAEVRRWRDEAERRGGSEITTLVILLYLEPGDTPRRRELVARWRRLEPHNLVPLLYGSLSESDLLAAAAATSVSDAHYDDVLRAFIDMLSRASSPALPRLQAAQRTTSPEEYRLTLAMSFWATVALPPVQRIATPCREASLAESRREHCRHVASVLWHRSDVLVFDMVGASMVRRLSDSAEEKAAADAFRREYAWLSARMADAYSKDGRGYAKRFMHWLFTVPDVTERGMLRQLVVEAGFPPAPPAGWQRESP